MSVKLDKKTKTNNDRELKNSCHPFQSSPD